MSRLAGRPARRLEGWSAVGAGAEERLARTSTAISATKTSGGAAHLSSQTGRIAAIDLDTGAPFHGSVGLHLRPPFHSSEAARGRGADGGAPSPRLAPIPPLPTDRPEAAAEARARFVPTAWDRNPRWVRPGRGTWTGTACRYGPPRPRAAPGFQQGTRTPPGARYRRRRRRAGGRSGSRRCHLR